MPDGKDWSLEYIKKCKPFEQGTVGELLYDIELKFKLAQQGM